MTDKILDRINSSQSNLWGINMKKLKNFAKTLWKDESGQGTAEYVLLLAIVAGVLVIFGPKIKDAITNKMESVSGQMDSIGQ